MFDRVQWEVHDLLRLGADHGNVFCQAVAVKHVVRPDFSHLHIVVDGNGYRTGADRNWRSAKRRAATANVIEPAIGGTLRESGYRAGWVP